MSVPERVRERREELNLSQTRLAGIAGVNPATVNGVEAGTRSPSVRTLEKLAAALGVGPAYFLEESAPKAPAR